MSAAKKTSLKDFDATARAAHLKNKKDSGEQISADEYMVSAMSLRKSDWKLLRQVADSRAEKEGGRRSMAKVIETLIEANREALKAEISD